jgi:hypothetical protein
MSIGGSIGVRRRGEGASDGAARLIVLAPGQVKERRAGLGIVPVLVRSLERFGRTFQVSHPQSDLADLVVGKPQAIEQTEAFEFLAGLPRLLFRFGPQPAHSLELGAVHPADPRIAAYSLAAHPAFSLLRPLAGPLVIADVAAGGDRVAEDVAGDAEIELAGGGSRRGFVDQRETGSPVSGVDHGHALEAHRHEVGVRIVMLLSQLHGLIGERDPVRDTTSHEGPERGKDGPSGVKRRLRQGLEQPLCPGLPTRADRSGSPAERLVCERHGHARGLADLVRVGVAREGPLQGLGRRVGLPRPPRRGAQPLEVIGTEAAIAIGGDEHVHRFCPCMALHGVATSLECLDHLRRFPLTGALVFCGQFVR